MIASYLRHQVQQVKVGIYLSDELSISNGIPQGSVLGPFSILAFINDFLQYGTCHPYLFADELKLASSTLIDLQNDLLSLLFWSTEKNFQSILKKRSDYTLAN